jgi:hypothetical protein
MLPEPRTTTRCLLVRPAVRLSTPAWMAARVSPPEYTCRVPLRAVQVPPLCVTSALNAPAPQPSDGGGGGGGAGGLGVPEPSDTSCHCWLVELASVHWMTGAASAVDRPLTSSALPLLRLSTRT